MPNRDETEERRTGIEWESPLGRIRIRGISILLTLVLVVSAVSVVLLWGHNANDQKFEDSIARILDSLDNKQAEMNYILTLSADDRAKLHLAMPDSLRKKLGREDQP